MRMIGRHDVADPVRGVAARPRAAAMSDARQITS
jgi:hypothetical protein